MQEDEDTAIGKNNRTRDYNMFEEILEANLCITRRQKKTNEFQESDCKVEISLNQRHAVLRFESSVR